MARKLELRRMAPLAFAAAFMASEPLRAQTYDDAMAAYRTEDYATAIAILRPLAEQGDAQSAFALGFMQAEGIGGPVDFTAAAQWYLAAAEQGHVQAQTNLGSLYASGRGVPQSWSAAIRWYLPAAEAGLPAAQFLLGTVHSVQGAAIGTLNPPEAIRWWQMAARQGHEKAQSKLHEIGESW